MSDISIHVKFFGGFRKFGESVYISVPIGSTIANIKKTLQGVLDGNGLVMDSVLANDSAILREDDIITCDAELSILPPVCGG